MSLSRRTALALVVLLVGAALSAVLLLEHRGALQGSGPLARLCGAAAGAPSGCETVARSAWAAPRGVPLAALGLMFCLALAGWLALALADPDADRTAAAARVAWLLLAAALGVDLLLLGVQAFVVRAFCTLCLLTYAVNAAALALLWPARRAALAALRAAQARPLVLGALLVGLAVTLAVWAADDGLRARAPSATAALGLPGTLEEAQARVRALQQTLDDPEKLRQYMQDKELRQFDAAPVQPIDLTTAPSQGDPGAPLHVVTYSDFLCPFCRQLAAGLQEFLPRTSGRVVVHFKHYPLDQACNPGLQRQVHPGACWLARGAICAQEQGRFEPFHDTVFSGELQAPGEADVKRLGATAGLDAARLSACLSAPATAARLAADIAEAGRVGVSSTPTVFINGRKLPSLNTFAQALERESVRLGLPAPMSPPGAGQ